MTDLREQRIRSISDRVGNRTLAWFGIRGHDAASLTRIPQFASSFAVTAPLGRPHLDHDVALEQITKARVDLDAYDIDMDDTDGPRQLRQQMLRALNRPSLLLSYRPSHFVSDLGFALHGKLEVLGLFKDRHQPYEYKPWVESQLARAGVATIPWRYVAEEHRDNVAAVLQTDPVILRTSRSSGGVGVVLVRPGDDLDALWPRGNDHLVSVAPFYERALPLNVSGCVFRSGKVVLHPASVQLIGIEGATDRRFGYCGNDFGAFAELPTDVQQAFDDMSRRVGEWLARDGYVGAFGVDALVVGDQVLFGEVNPRLQGSTLLSSYLCSEAGLPDIVLDHCAALLGLEPVNDFSLGQWSSAIPSASHLVLHQSGEAAAPAPSASALWDAGLGGLDIQLAPDRDVRVEPGAVLARLVLSGSVTSTGYDLTAPLSHAVSMWKTNRGGTQ